MRTIRRWQLALIAVAVGAPLVAAAAVWHVVGPSYSSPFMDVRWHRAADGTVAGRVTGWDGRPEVGQPVESTDAGGTHATATDGDGRFALPLQGDLDRLTLVGIDAVGLTRWNRPGDGGLAFEVHLKRPPPPSRGPL